MTESMGFQGYHVICLSPLARIFQPKYQQELMKNPDSVFDTKVKFDIVAKKSSGAIVLPFNQITDLTKFFGRSTNQDRTIIDCYNWLTGGLDGMLSRETDHTGCVAAPVDLGLVEAAIHYTQLQAEDPDEAEKFKKKITSKKPEMSVAMKKAKDLSTSRVMRTIRTVYHNLKKQQQANSENNLGQYMPSPSEYLCAYVLAAEEKKTSEDRKIITAKFAELMNESITPGA